LSLSSQANPTNNAINKSLRGINLRSDIKGIFER